MARDFDRYLEQSRLLSVGLVASLPLLACYELGILFTGSPVENHVSALVKRMIAVLGGDAYLVLTGVVAALFVLALVAKYRGPGREFKNYVVIIVEAAVYAAILGPVIHLLGVPLSAGTGGFEVREFAGQAILYMGAGVWEELFFRLVLLGGLYHITVKQLGGSPAVFSVLALLISSAAFSAIHHMGSMGEPFVPRVFLYRMMAGLVLGLLYLSRGLGICVYTHALYNVGLLLMRWAEVGGEA